MKNTASPARPGQHTNRFLRVALAGAFLLASSSGGSVAAEPNTAAGILQDLRSFDQLGSVLYIAAHPDDENTQLIACLARGRHYRTAYLSVTRGDGGQNVLGPQLGDELGVIRTQELLAARRIDGGRQFFTRAIDFGYSKDYRETLRIWNRQEVLSDIVRVIREFRPDVLITRFSTEPGRTHGHHTASAVLALEAFKLAGDPKAFPDQLRDLTPWQPKRILWNAGGFQRGGLNSTNLIRINAGGEDPATGESFADIAGRSRSMHKTQGFGDFRGRGGGGPRYESFELLDGEPATNDILDGVDTTWGRYAGGKEIGEMADEVISKFNTEDPAASVPALLKIKTRLAALTSNPVVDEKREQLNHILAECLGLTVKTTIPHAEVVPGEPLKLRHTVVVHSSVVPVRWLAVRYPAIKSQVTTGAALSADQSASRDSSETLPANTPLSQPYWLREPHGTGVFQVDDPSLIGRPENPPVFPIEQVFEVGGRILVLPDQPVQIMPDPAKGETRRLDVISPVSLKFASETALFTPGASHPVTVEVTSARPDANGTLQLEAPAGWKITPVSQSFQLAAAGDHARFTFTIQAPSQATTGTIAAQANVAGKVYSNERIVIHYQHIPLQLLQPPADLKAICLQLAIRGHRIGYLPGAGDDVAGCLQQMGYEVATLTGADLTPEKLKGLDAVVVGVRAFNVRDDLAPHLSALFDYVQGGGNLIEQYNRPRGLRTDKFAPYDLQISGERVTDETAPVTFLAPDNPVLNTPNKITSADFEGWIQERGIYYPNRWDDHFTPILACHDPGEAPLKGGLLVAQYGKGYLVYTGLVFFRQLPAGVPGAYRLFANLVSLGK